MTRAPRARFLAGIALSTGVLCGCGAPGPASDPSLDMDVAVSPTPALEGAGQVRVTLTDTLGAPVEEATVVITGLMTHAGMAAVRDTARREEPGLWVAPDFDFTMTGDWVLEVRATLPDGRRAARDHPIRVVGRPPGAGGGTGDGTGDGTGGGAGDGPQPGPEGGEEGPYAR